MNIFNSYKISDSDIAVIGLSCRFPGAHSVKTFWQNLCQGKESVSFFSDEELLALGIDPALLNDPNYVKAGAVLPDIELFDASFFGFTPREAETMDPQHRLFLECAHEALESAGYPQDASSDTSAYQGLIGVYAGVGMNSYLLHNLYPNRKLMESVSGYQLMIANGKDFLPTQVSYKLNLKGPSVNIQTACSTSLVAVHLACQGLLNGECDIALAGGVSVHVLQKMGYLYQEGMILSPDGHCRAFDAKAQGIVSGNGVGIVVLKRLEEALANGDYIYAVIKGSAINNDGSLKVGYTAPSVEGQSKVIAEAMVIAGVSPETITYVETHGTGTVLGDPIEIAALTEAFQTQKRDGGKRCAIGSVKTNIGHTDTAAGVAGLIKTVLALKHQLIPPTLHFEKPNPKIDFANSPFYVNTELSEWRSNTPRRAGVSSFGIGGTNAHVILEEAPPREPSLDSRPWQLLLLSAKTPSALDTATANLAEYLRQERDLGCYPSTSSGHRLADVAYTLQVGRQRHRYRRMLVCQELDEAISALNVPQSPPILTSFHESDERPVGFMFPGQGTQYINMGLELYKVEPTFRKQVDLCAELLTSHLGFDLRLILYPSEERVDTHRVHGETTPQLEQTAITQPALFVIEYALAKLWLSWGVQPQVMIGHSIGEYVAACLAGVFSLQDALALVAIRGQLMQALPQGAMLAVSLPEEELSLRFLSGQPLGQELSLAAINGPAMCVVSGRVEAIEALQKQLAGVGVTCRRLHTSHAFHSEMMTPILEVFTERVKSVNLQPPQIPYISNVTGTWITDAEATNPTYWAQHLRQTVRFAEGLAEFLKEPELILLEVGPGRTLSTLAKRHPAKTTDHMILRSLRHAQERQGDLSFLLAQLGQVWLAGGAIDWSGFYTHQRRHRLPLPTYPFERQRYWSEPPKTPFATQDFDPKLEKPTKKPDIADWFYIPSWKRALPPVRRKLPTQECWLLFVDECGLGTQLARQLEEEGQDVIIVRVGERMTKLDDQMYTLHPQRKEEYDFLLQDILTSGKSPQMIVYLWSVTSTPSHLDLDSIEASQTLGFYSLLFLAQALGSIINDVALTVITNYVQQVTEEDILCPEKATVLGPVKVIPQEYPHIHVRTIDVLLKREDKLVEQLLAELAASSSVFSPTADVLMNRSTVIAYRGKYRWEQTFEPLRLDKRHSLPLHPKGMNTSAVIKEGGVYLITGGLGGIGLVLAEDLASFQAKLVLIGRSAFPDRENWEEWLVVHDEDDEVSRKIQKIQALEELGAEVLVISADVSNDKQMQAAINEAENSFGQLNGVIHAAGITKESFNLIQEISPTECERQFQPKIHGLLVLQKVLQGIDFCVLFSSLSSVLGGLGFVAYSAANLFMDAFAHKHNAKMAHNQEQSIRWFSVNWDGWQLNKEGEGLEPDSSFGASLAELAITPEEGVKAFKTLITLSHVDQVIVSTGELQARISKWINFEASRQADAESVVHSFSSHARPTLQSTYVAPRNQMEQNLVDIWQNLLGIEEVGIHDDFFELGGHSLLGTQLISRVRKAFQISLPLQSLFEEPTVEGLANYIEISQRVAQGWQSDANSSADDLEESIL